MSAECSVEGCSDFHYALDLCVRHYRRIKRSGGSTEFAADLRAASDARRLADFARWLEQWKGKYLVTIQE